MEIRGTTVANTNFDYETLELIEDVLSIIFFMLY